MVRKVSPSIHVFRDGGYFGFLRGFPDRPPSINMDEGSNIKMTLLGEFQNIIYDQNGNKHEFDPLTDELVPVLSINGSSYRLGIYIPTSCTPRYNDLSSQEVLSIEAYDRCWLPLTTTGANRVYFKKGTSYLDAVESLLAASGVGVINRDKNSDANKQVFLEDREDWDLGTNYLTIINQLLNEINFGQLWFNNIGEAMLRPISTPTVKNIQHSLSTKNPSTLVHPGLSRTTDLYRTPNVFICSCNNPEKTYSMTAIAKNTNEYSPLSIQRRGREIVQFEKVDNISSQQALQNYADRLLFESLMSGETYDVATSLLPGWGVGDVVSLTYQDVHALCVSRSWNMQLKAGGTMQHRLEKIVYNFDSNAG